VTTLLREETVLVKSNNIVQCHTHPKIKDAPKKRRESSHLRAVTAGSSTSKHGSQADEDDMATPTNHNQMIPDSLHGTSHKRDREDEGNAGRNKRNSGMAGEYHVKNEMVEDAHEHGHGVRRGISESDISEAKLQTHMSFLSNMI
jgi:hypothetical protein